MRALILAIVAIAILFAAGTVAIDTTLQSSGDRFDVEGEEWSPDPGNESELNESGIAVAEYDSRVSVEDSTEQKMIDGEDYEWDQSQGTVTALEDGRLASEDTATIDYGYTVPSDGQRDMAALWGQLVSIGPELLFVLMVALVLLSMASLARIG